MVRNQALLLIAVILLVAGVVTFKEMRQDQARPAASNAVPAPRTPPAHPTADVQADAVNTEALSLPLLAGPSGRKLPQLVDLGSTECIPCKEMAPILDELRVELKGRVDVIFIDTEKDPKTADDFGIQVIPTQVLLDAAGKELDRHEGVYPKAELIARMRELKMLK
jgi:thioredoxin 1